jgi:hypothetical protein
MERLSKEFLEKIAAEGKTSVQYIQDRIDRELKLMFEEIVKRYSK